MHCLGLCSINAMCLCRGVCSNNSLCRPSGRLDDEPPGPPLPPPPPPPPPSPPPPPPPPGFDFRAARTHHTQTPYIIMSQCNKTWCRHGGQACNEVLGACRCRRATGPGFKPDMAGARLQILAGARNTSGAQSVSQSASQPVARLLTALATRLLALVPTSLVCRNKNSGTALAGWGCQTPV